MTFAYGTAEYGGQYHDLPTVVVTSPTTGQKIVGPTVTVTWTYAQTQGDPQASYQVEFVSNDGLTSHYDSGWVASRATSAIFALALNGVRSANVSVRVSVQSNQGQTVSPLVPFSTQSDNDE